MKTDPSTACSQSNGVMPACAPLAVPYVPFQQTDAPVYSQTDALRQGTLYPALNLPFHLALDGAPVQETMLSQIQALQFVLQELTLYLDTHEEDQEAFQLFQQYSKTLEGALAAYQKEHGPLLRSGAAAGSSWQWSKGPWPWEQKGEQ